MEVLFRAAHRLPTNNITRRWLSLNKTTNVCVVGTGRMARMRFPALANHKNANLSHIVGLEPTEDLARQYQATGTADFDSVLSDPTVDAVWIATGTPAHVDLIHRAARAGKAVAVEKPVADSVADINSCYDICEANGVPLFCSFQRRFDPNFLEVRDQVKSGMLGTLQSIHAVFRDHPRPNVDWLVDGGDLFHDCGVHDIDFVRSIVGEEPTEVFATATSLDLEFQSRGVVDTATLLLRFPHDLMCYIELTRFAAYGYDQRLEVFGTRGMAQVHNPLRNTATVSTAQGTQQQPARYSFPQRFQAAYSNEVDHFIQLVRGEAQPIVTRADALAATAIAEAARVSAQQDSRVSLTKATSGQWSHKLRRD